MATSVTPWWDVLRLRDEIAAGSGSIDDVQMSLFNAVYGTGGEKPRYADARYYGEITHPSPNLTELGARVVVRLSAERYTAAPALWHLDQAMGGGKSHGLIGLWHLAAHPDAMRATDFGREVVETATRISGGAIPLDHGQPLVVVLACDNMTAGRGDSDIDGPAITLHERFLWRLFGGDHSLFKRYRPHSADKHKLAEALAAVGRPILILVDEVLDYVRQLSASDNADLAVKDMAFLRALCDTVNDVPRVAMVVVMIASDKDSMALDAAGQDRRQEIESLLVRNGKTTTVTSHTDFAAILRRRLFENHAPAEVVASTTRMFLDAMTGPWAKVFENLPKTRAGDFGPEVERCYPFHPLLITLAEQEWSPVAGFQKVRSTIRIFAATAHALWKRGREGQWAPMLIGPGDVPLSAAEVREAVIGSGLISDARTQANYRQIGATDVVADDDRGGVARQLDLARPPTLFATNPRAAERMATALFLYSVGARGQGRRGGTEAELKAAAFAADAGFGITDADVVLQELQSAETGLAALERIEGRGGQPARLLLSTQQTVHMLFRAARAGVSDDDRDDEFAKAVLRLVNTGPFRDKKFVEAKKVEDDPRTLRAILEGAGLDDARSTRLVVLDPRRFSLLNGVDQDTRDAIRAAFGTGENKLAVQWASSAVFAVVNTQLRKNARGVVTNYVAWCRVCEFDAVRLDGELLDKAKEQRDDAKRGMDRAIKGAYQHVVYLAAGEGGEGRVDKDVRFEQPNQSALDGSVVWAELAHRGKTFGTGEFSAKALIHNLSPNDYGRALGELRDLFWSAPRMPLLPGGESDLQDAVYNAVRSGVVRLVGPDGADCAVTRAADIAVGSSSLALHLPKAKDAEAQPEHRDGASRAGEGEQGGPSGSKKQLGRLADAAPPEPEVQVKFSLNTSLSEKERRTAVWKAVSSLGEQVDTVASHVQLVVNVVLPESQARALVEHAKAAGASPTSTPI
jgi:hypothetical protein